MMIMMMVMIGAAAGAPVPLIIDTDMSTDCDDVGALCIAHAMMNKGEAELIAVVHNTGLNTGVGAVSVINQYYGRPDIPVGAYIGPYDRVSLTSFPVSPSPLNGGVRGWQ